MSENSINWLQVTLHTNSNDCAALEEILYACGASSITLLDSGDQPILEPSVGEHPLWQDVVLTALFCEPDTQALKDSHSNQQNQTLEHFLNDFLQEQLVNSNASYQQLHTERLENQAWERSCLDQFKPILFNQRLRICPSWIDEPEQNRIDVLLDPGLAFGTGSHATTFLCLAWLDAESLQGKTVIDFGCGSGILGIAALKLGASQVIFIDNDPQAIRATKENLTRNDLHSQQLICTADLDYHALTQQLAAYTADIVLANILAEPLTTLAPIISQLAKPNGKLVLSGILSEQEQQITNAYQAHFDNFAIEAHEDWLRIDAIKSKS